MPMRRYGCKLVFSRFSVFRGWNFSVYRGWYVSSVMKQCSLFFTPCSTIFWRYYVLQYLHSLWWSKDDRFWAFISCFWMNSFRIILQFESLANQETSCPSLVSASTSPPLVSSKCRMSALPHSAAICKGVWPSPSLRGIKEKQLQWR